MKTIIFLYRYDAVSSTAIPTHWKDKMSSFALRSEFQEDHLKILGTKRKDAGLYKCRVDYKLMQTSFQSINLTVITLPSEPIILYNGTVVERWLEVKEGQRLNLECYTRSGSLSPDVTWWSGTQLIDESFER